MATTPNVMEDVKDWLLNKCRDAGSRLAVDRPVLHGGRHLSFSNVVVTPSNIPEFTIPDGSLSPPGRESSDTDGAESSTGTCGSTSPRLQQYRQRASANRLLTSPTVRARSTPVSPIRSMGEQQSAAGRPSYGSGDGFYDSSDSMSHTNSDPMSLAALSLPQAKMHTNFGFETLRESPNTRRKESLFHTDTGGPQAMRTTTGSLEAIGPRIIREECDQQQQPVPTYCRNKRRHNVSAVIAPLGVVLAPAPCDTTLGVPYKLQAATLGARYAERMPSPRHLGTSGAHGCDHCQMSHHFRRSSLREDISYEDVSSSSSSTETSPSFFRRNKSSSHLLLMPTCAQGSVGDADLTSAGSSPEALAACPGSSCRSHRGSAVSQPEAKLGEVWLSITYLPKEHQLKVRLLRIENLAAFHSAAPPRGLRPLRRRSSTGGLLTAAGVPSTAQSLNPYVKMHLVPGRARRQTSKVVRHTNNPVFNEHFVFSDIPHHQVAETRLQVKVCHRATKLGRGELLGEVQLGLDALVPAHETSFVRQFEMPNNKHELGYVQLSVCFHASAEKLSVSVIQVTDLARHMFNGAPDPYVRIELHQQRRAPIHRNTKPTKKSTAPVFNESFTFAFSPKIEDLHSTKLTVTVLDRATLRADAVLGQVRLGYGATEEAESHHWNQVLQQPGRVATYWHMLMDPVEE